MERESTMQRFADGELEIVFATGAFGMGVDIQDIRGVVHYLVPESLEQYYQEVGRAGRDGDPAFGLLLHTPINARVRRDLIRGSLRTADDVRDVWTNVCDVGRSSLKTISPWTEFQGRDDDHALFYAFQRIGALVIVARGTGRLHCFAARGPAGAALLQRLNSATRIGNTTAAIRKLDLDPAATMNELFELYDQGELQLALSPDKTLLFETRELREDDVQAIVGDITRKVEKRLADFDEFIGLVDARVDPSEALRSRFGG
jgi:ATP-dependent DNA helicase RecQ